MKIIYDKPRSGKTTKLIKMCSVLGGYIVCADKNRADYIMRISRELGLKIPYPITFHEFLSKQYYSKGVKRVYIDNADQLLMRLAAGVQVQAIVMDDVEEENQKYNGGM